MRRTWLVAGSLVALAALGASGYLVVNVMAHERTSEAHTFDASGLRSIQVDGEHSDVEIIGRDVDDVTVEIDVSHGLRRTKQAVEVVDDVLRLTNACPNGPPFWCSVEYRIVMPTTLVVDIHADSGHTTLRNVDADVTVDVHNGGIELDQVSGAIDARSLNGSVRGSGLKGDVVTARSTNGRVTLAFAEPPTRVEARSTNGSVTVVVPDDEHTYRLEVDAVNGGTDPGVRADPASERSIVAVTTNGSAAVRYPTG